MIGYSDDAKVLELLAPLRRLEPVPFSVPDRTVRRLRRPVLVVAVVVVALALTGVAIANGVGAFKGIGAAERSQSGSDVLDPRLTRSCPSDLSRSIYDPFCHFVPTSVRLISTLASGRKVFVAADTHGDLCVVDEGRTITSSCGPPLSGAHPITATFGNDSPTTGGEFVAGGVAVDGVTSVSFRVWGREVTVPVKHNVWVYTRRNSTAHGATCILVHLADGSTVNPFRGSDDCS